MSNILYKILFTGRVFKQAVGSGSAGNSPAAFATQGRFHVRFNLAQSRSSVLATSRHRVTYVRGFPKNVHVHIYAEYIDIDVSWDYQIQAFCRYKGLGPWLEEAKYHHHWNALFEDFYTFCQM